MDTARSLHDHRLVEAEELWNMPFVDRTGFICRGCAAPVFPASFTRDVNKRRPYFTLGKMSRHEAGCDVDGEEQLLHRAQRHRVGASDGFPLPFPSRVVFDDTHAVEAPRDPAALALAAARSARLGMGAARGTGRGVRQRFHGHTIKTIRPACRTFIQFPHDRETLPLEIPGLPGRSYARLFHHLGKQAPAFLPLRRQLFYACLHWHAEPVLDESVCELALEAGRGAVPPAQCRLRVEWGGWSKSRRRSFLRELFAARTEVIEGRGSSDAQAWVFFIGTQSAADPALFSVGDERFVCCLCAPASLPTPQRAGTS